MANKEIKSLKITDKNGQSYTLSVPANGANVDTSDFALKSELDEFDTEAYKDGVNAFINEAKKDVLTIDRFDAFDTNAYEAKVNAFIDEAKKDILTIDKFDAFDTGAYRGELQTIADEVTNKMAIFNELTEIDLDELKEQIKAEILAELNGAGA